MAFVHSLVLATPNDKTGWFAPVELGEAAPHYVSYVVPVAATGKLFDEYACEMASAGKRNQVGVYTMKRVGDQSLVLEVKQFELWFTVRPVAKNKGRFSYLGKLNHPDFSHGLVEIEPRDPKRLEELCEEQQLFVIGCDPFKHYSGNLKAMDQAG